jgi:hypothetical protein
MIDWDRWGGEPPDRYQIAMLVLLSVTVITLLALLGGVVDAPGSEPRSTTDGCENVLSPAEPVENQPETPVAPMLENASLRCGADTRDSESGQTTNSVVGVRLE